MKITEVKLIDLKPDKLNGNVGTERGHKMIQDSLREDGAGRGIVIDKNGAVVAGNKTLENAVDIGLEKAIIVETTGKELVITKRTDWDLYEDESPRRYAWRDNQSSLISIEFDPEQLAEEIAQGVDFGGIFTEEEQRGILDGLEGEPPKEETTGPQVDRAEELRQEWETEVGQVWMLGEHRLAVGDCTDAAVVEALMGGEYVDLMFTDPPYNVSYQNNESAESLRKRNRRTDGLVISNDSMTDNEFVKFLETALRNVPLQKGKSFYMCAPAGHPETLFRNTINSVSGWLLKQCIVWVKNQFVFGRQDYHYRHESILYGWIAGASHYFVNDRTQDSVWEIDRPRVSEFHPTMKPIALPSKAIANSCRKDEIVYDPFLGSGTTLIACENLGRRCRGIEIDPGYAAVTLQRFLDHTSIKPELIT